MLAQLPEPFLQAGGAPSEPFSEFNLINRKYNGAYTGVVEVSPISFFSWAMRTI